jgi:quinol-cytochrome oxidoreductase complex cytochrome b subunit
MTPGSTERVARRELLIRELLATMVCIIALMALALALPIGYHPATDSGNLVTAPWPVLWLQELLRYLPPFVAGVAVPLAVLGFLTALPWLPGACRPEPRRLYRFGPHQALVLGLGFLWVLLTVLGL